MENNEDFEIKPQWVSVKEELISDFFELSNSFSHFTLTPSSTELKKAWISILKSLYIKVRMKIKNNKDYDKFVEDMDLFVFEFKPVSITEMGIYTKKLCQFIEETGITKVETQKEQVYTPHNTIKAKFNTYNY
jgi:hypothetical protein